MSTQNANQTDILEWLEQLPASVEQPQSQAIEQSIGPMSLSESVATALDNPVHFPPLTESVFPGDRVAIVVQSGAPQARPLVRALLQRLLTANIEPADIRVVVTKELAAEFGIKVQSRAKSVSTSESAVESTTDSGDSNSEPAEIQVCTLDILGDEF